MKTFSLKTTIHTFDTVKDFAEEFKIGQGDLVLCNRHFYEDYFKALDLDCDYISPGDYGKGEPTDEMFDAINRDVRGAHKRVIGIGGGTVLDIAKLFALKYSFPVVDLFTGRTEKIKNKQLVLVPTTAGTGSEVTNISILALNSLGTKMGLAANELYPDDAVLIPQLLEKLPFEPFLLAAIDALIHSIESSMSPKSNEITRMFGHKALTTLLNGFKTISEEGPDARFPLLGDFLSAATYAGISFGNAGNGAVHAMSYPLGAAYHVPHGEANYAMFSGVMKNYLEVRSDGQIAVVQGIISDILGCDKDQAFPEVEKLLSSLIPRKALHEYGMKEEEIISFTDSVIANQQRLLANNFAPLDRDRMIKIYTELF